MATFKAGQRVKRIAGSADANYMMVPPGNEGVVIGGPHQESRTKVWLWDVQWDKCGKWNAAEGSIVPLTDPKADEFIERIKKLKPYDEPVVTRRLETSAVVSSKPAEQFE